ncbi:hypothetical protein CEXT_49621 [Caerostris extrusa]|uniref:Uncharacterized protein n=1 Tax=Caerostris extrusa TaxID=172846 RepID=A0AAV4VAG3_CAEEX|nr:hypothetical protein CEXT_49621 [Caerostris extrusa]
MLLIFIPPKEYTAQFEWLLKCRKYFLLNSAKCKVTKSWQKHLGFSVSVRFKVLSSLLVHKVSMENERISKGYHWIMIQMKRVAVWVNGINSRSWDHWIIWYFDGSKIGISKDFSQYCDD